MAYVLGKVHKGVKIVGEGSLLFGLLTQAAGPLFQKQNGKGI